MRKYLVLLTLLSQVSFAQIKTYCGKPLTAVEFESKIKKAMDSLQVPGMSVAVINNGKIAFNKGFGFANVKLGKQTTTSTLFEAASLSKAVFAYYVLKLAHEGKIDLDKPLYAYLPAPDIEDERYQKITARMVLSHTTGLPNWRETDKMKLAFNPGEQFSYSGEAFVYLAKVVADLNGMSLKDLDGNFQKEVAKPLKLRNSHFVITPDIAKNLAHGYQNNQTVKDERDRTSFDPAGGLYANATSFASFLIQLMKQKTSYEEMFKPIIHLAKNDPIREIFGVDFWSLGLAGIKIKDSVNYWHGGNNLGYTSSFLINPEKRFGYVFFTNADQCNGMKKVVEDILFQ